MGGKKNTKNSTGKIKKKKQPATGMDDGVLVPDREKKKRLELTGPIDSKSF